MPRVRILYPAITEIMTPRMRVGKSSAPRVNTTGIEPPTPEFVMGGMGRRPVRQRKSLQCKAPRHGLRSCHQKLEVKTGRSLVVHKCVAFCVILGSADPIDACWHSLITKALRTAALTVDSSMIALSIFVLRTWRSSLAGYERQHKLYKIPT